MALSDVSQKRLLRFFPVPEFLSMPTVGFDVTNEAIRFIEFEEGKLGLRLKKYGKKDIVFAEGKTDNLLESPELKKALEEIQKEFRFNFIHASLPEEKAYLFKTEIPNVLPQEIRSAIEFKLEENVPLNSAQSLFDYTLIGGAKHAEDHLDVSVSVLPKSLVSLYVNLFHSAGFVPLSFEVEAQAIARAVIGRNNHETFLIVNFGETKTGLFIVQDGIVHFTSTLPVGGTSLTDAIRKHFSIDEAEAERIRQEVGVVKDKKNIDLFFSMMSTLSVLRDEINRLLLYWQSKGDQGVDHSPKVDRIILCGTDAYMGGFREYLEASMKIDSEFANVWINVFDVNEYTPPISFTESLAYVTAIGLALPKS